MSQPPQWPVPDAPQGPEASGPGPVGGPPPAGPPTGAAAPPHHSPAGSPAHPDSGQATSEPAGWAQQHWGHGPSWGAPGPSGGHGAQPGLPGPVQQGGPAWGQAPPGWVAHRPKPGIIPLRPIALGEIYDGAFQAIRSNPRTMIGFSALVLAVTTLLTTVPQAAALVSLGASDIFDPEAAADISADEAASDVAGFLSAFYLPYLIQALALTVVTGLLIVAVSNAVLGRRTAPGQLWQRARRRVPALIGLAILVLLIALVALVLFLAPGLAVLALAEQGAIGVVLLLLGFVLWGLAMVAFYFGFWALAAPALLLENLSVIRSLRRSAGLVRRSFWRVLGIMLLTTLMVGVLSSVVAVPFTVFGTLIGFGQETPGFGTTLAQLLLSQVGTIISGAVLYPLSAAVTALLYIDLRMRQEGLDVELMRASEVPAG